MMSGVRGDSLCRARLIHTYHLFSTDDFLHAVVDAVDHAEIPIVAMQSALLDLVFNRGLSEHLKIVLCGQGADSLFGLSIMYSYHKLRRVTKPALAPLFRLLASTLGRRPQETTSFRGPACTHSRRGVGSRLR